MDSIYPLNFLGAFILVALLLWGIRSSAYAKTHPLDTAKTPEDSYKKQRHEQQKSSEVKSHANLVINNDIFIVHGHNENLKETIASFVSDLGLKPIILHLQANRGRSIFQKFEDHSDVGFAIVIMTGDDIGKPRFASNKADSKESLRARQNVIFEMGYFMGKRGKDRVLILQEEAVEVPSDILGIVPTMLDEAGKWREELVRELAAAGYEVDTNREFR